MDILLLTPQLPYPAHQGTTLRNFNIIQGVAIENQIDLLSFDERGQTAGTPRPLADLCRTVERVAAPSRSTGKRLWQMVSTSQPDMALRLYSERYTTALETCLAQRSYDIVQVEGIELAWTMTVIRRAVRDSAIVYDAHNAETLLQTRSGAVDRGSLRRWPAAFYSSVQSARLARYEAWACQEADSVVAVSEKDREALRALSGIGADKIHVIPNSIDTAVYARTAVTVEEAQRYDIVFSGKMDYRPNVDAVLWFADAVWPLIKREKPRATWAVVGQKPHARLERLASLPDVAVTGWVADVKPYLAGAGVFIMPFRVGSGTRLKLIEALAAECAIVSTRVGAEGFPVVDGEHLLFADTAEAFARSVVLLLNDTATGANLGRQGKLFAEHYDWRVIVPEFQNIYHDLLAS
jgi:glycosyltransferase involved in cell wall biosynthesis